MTIIIIILIVAIVALFVGVGLTISFKPKCDHRWFVHATQYVTYKFYATTATIVSQECVKCGRVEVSNWGGYWDPNTINRRNGTTNWNFKYGDDCEL